MDKVVRIEHTIKASTVSQARSIFRLASNRLLHVRGWSRLADSLLFTSEHRDCQGAPVSRVVMADDYINLNSEDQRPFGWMQVTCVAEDVSETGGEVVLITRPVGLPFEADNDDNLQARPTVLSVVRRGLEVTAAFMMEANPVATVFERVGVYVVQWRSLVTGLLGDLTHSDIQAEIASAESHLAQRI